MFLCVLQNSLFSVVNYLASKETVLCRLLDFAYPQRDLNPCYRRERAVSLAARR